MAKMDFFKDFKFEKVDNELVQKKLAEKNEKAARRLIDESNERAHIPLRFKDTFFSGLDGKYTEEFKHFSVEEDNDKVLLVAGPCGTGKTSVLCASLHERALNGLPCGLYMSDRLLTQQIRTSRSFAAKESETDFYERLGSVSFLCIDEVGTSEDLDLERRFLRTVLATRYDNMLPTVISTNYNFKTFKEFLSDGGDNDPIMDRLYSIIIPRVLSGESRRPRSCLAAGS